MLTCTSLAEKLKKGASKDDTSSVGKKLPPFTLPACIRNPALLSFHQNEVDVQMSVRILTSILWLRVWQFIQMRTAHTISSGDSNDDLPMQQMQQSLSDEYSNLMTQFTVENESLHPCVKIMTELCSMHLYVSLEDIQYLGGKDRLRPLAPEQSLDNMTMSVVS